MSEWLLYALLFSLGANVVLVGWLLLVTADLHRERREAGYWQRLWQHDLGLLDDDGRFPRLDRDEEE